MQKTQGTILIAIYYILGLISYFSEQTIAISALLLAFTIFLLYKNKISNRFSVILYLIFMFAILNCNLQMKESDFLSQIAPQKATITAKVASIPTTNRTDRTKFYADVEKISYSHTEKKNINSKTIVTLFGDKEDFKKLEIGDEIQLTGKLNLPMPAKNPSQFDYKNYLRNFDTFTIFYAYENSLKIVSKANTPYWKLLQNINRTRSDIIEKHAANIKSPNIELLGGIVFGDDAVNPPDNVKQSFINSGLLHILAASGMNVTLIFGIWFFISQKFRFHYKLSLITGILLIVFYTAMTGFGPSILRASLMLIFILLGKLIDRDADTLSLLFFVATLMLVYDPAMINQIGFQLSFAVTFGLLLTCPIIFDKIENKFLNFMASATIVPLIAQLYAAPIQMYYFNTFSAYSILANIAIIPFLTIVSFLGFISSTLALIPPLSFYICKISDIILNPFLSGLIHISDFFSNLPNSLITTTHPAILQIIMYYLLVLCLTLLIKAEFKSKKLIIVAFSTFICLVFLLLPIKNSSCEVIFFDMGNADSALIKTPKNQYFMIDTGKAPYHNGVSSAKQIVLKYMKDNGIKKLNGLILTHFDADHSGGSIDIIKNVKVETVYINSLKSESKMYPKIMKFLNTNHINYKIPKHNENIVKEDDLTLINITPDPKNLEDENEKSLITLLNYKKHKILFMGDGGITAYKYLSPDLVKDIDVIKVGHHGSRSSLNKDMLKTLSPDFAIISTGQNSYGHPYKSTTKLIKNSCARLLRTDYNNAVKVSIDKTQLKVMSFNTKQKRFSNAYTVK